MRIYKLCKIDKFCNKWGKILCFEFYAVFCWVRQSYLLDETTVFSFLFSSNLFNPKSALLNLKRFSRHKQASATKKRKVCNPCDEEVEKQQKKVTVRRECAEIVNQWATKKWRAVVLQDLRWSTLIKRESWTADWKQLNLLKDLPKHDSKKQPFRSLVFVLVVSLCVPTKWVAKHFDAL
jgi:hypothetical protein